jgi:hypothetical protein
VSAAGVVEAFDVFEHRVRQLDAGVPALPVQQFNLHATPEGLDDGIVVRVTNRSQGWQEPCLLGAPGECPQGEMTPYSSYVLITHVGKHDHHQAKQGSTP